MIARRRKVNFVSHSMIESHFRVEIKVVKVASTLLESPVVGQRGCKALLVRIVATREQTVPIASDLPVDGDSTPAILEEATKFPRHTN